MRPCLYHNMVHGSCEWCQMSTICIKMWHVKVTIGLYICIWLQWHLGCLLGLPWRADIHKHLQILTSVKKSTSETNSEDIRKLNSIQHFQTRSHTSNLWSAVGAWHSEHNADRFPLLRSLQYIKPANYAHGQNNRGLLFDMIWRQ